MEYKLKNSEVVFKGQMLDVQVDHIEYESGNTGVREIAVHPGGAAVMPLTAGGKVVMVAQYRHPFHKIMIEIPAGKLDHKEDPLICARRELEEETGYKSDSVEKLGTIVTTPGYSTEVLHLYIARDLVPGNHSRDEGEHGMEVLELTFGEIDEMIKNGEILDSKTICAVYMAKQVLGL